MKIKNVFLILFFLFCSQYFNIRCQNDCNTHNINNNVSILNKAIKLAPEKIETVLINFNNLQEFSFIDKKSSNLIVNIFSINCDIQLNNSIDVNIEHRHDNDIFSINLNSNNNLFSVKPLNNFNNNYRNCPLVINSIYINEYILTIEETDPTIFYFDKNLSSIQLLYEIKNEDSFVTFSFAFNEIATFKISYDYGEKTKVKIISNSNNIFLTELSVFINNTIRIKIERIDIYEYPVLLKFKIFTNNNKVLTLQKNYLNQGFVTSNLKYRYYYMEIFKDEEGEIMLHDKRQNGKILGKLCRKKECPFDDIINSFPSENNNIKENDFYLEYKEHLKKLRFNYTQTKYCEEGCFLLIFYQHNLTDLSYINNNITIGYEFTLLTRVWDKEDWKNTQIINIPNSEYIFGCFDQNSINNHYYSFFVSREEEIYLEIKTYYVEGFYGEGKKKLNTYNDNIKDIYKLDIKKEKQILIINKDEKKFNNTYISLTFRSKDYFIHDLSFYYFRIFKLKENDKLIIPLDSNIGTISQGIEYKCFFLLKNDYNDFNLNYSIFIDNINDVNNHFYIKQNLTDEIDISQNTLNDIECTDISNRNFFFIDNNYNNLYYILFDFSISSHDINYGIYIVSTFFDNEKDIYPQIYSPQLYGLNSINFHISLTFEYHLMVMWLNGEGKIYNKPDKIYTMNENARKRTFSFSSKYIKDINSINEEDFIFYMNFNLKLEDNIIEEIKYGELKSLIIQERNEFPIYFYMQFYKEDLTDINFKILDYLIDSNFTIEGFICDIDDIKKKGNEKYIENKGYYKGDYDLFSKSGFLTLSNVSDNIGDKINYLLIKIDIDNKITRIDSNLTMLIEIIALPKKASTLGGGYIPINNFISGSINLLLGKKAEAYYNIYIGENGHEKRRNLILEFNRNYEGIILNFWDNYSVINSFIFGKGFIKYKLNKTNDFISFIIKWNNTINTEGLLNANYMIRYYSDYTKNISSEFKFYNDSIIKDNETIGENITRLLFEFYIKPIYKKYKICGSLFLKENLNELLSTSAFLHNKPIDNEIILVNSNEEKFRFNMTINTTNVKKYIYIMQLKIDFDYDQNNDYYRSKEFMIYTIEKNLTQYLKKEEKKQKKENDKTTIILLYITAIIIFIILIIVFVICGIIYCHFKRKNKDLSEKVLSISFSTGQSDEVINKNNSKRDQEYETPFIEIVRILNK